MPKDELEGIEETEEELCTISEHVLALENILRGIKKPVRLLILAVYVVMNDGAEIDILNRLGTRPEDCWRPEEAARFQTRENIQVDGGADTNF